MVFGWIATFVANQAKLVDKLADSYPIRRAAQLAIYFMIRNPSPTAQKFVEGNVQSSWGRMKRRLKQRPEKLKKN